MDLERKLAELENLVGVKKQGKKTPSKEELLAGLSVLLETQKGEKGDMPKKYVDYFTPEDVEQFKSAVYKEVSKLIKPAINGVDGKTPTRSELLSLIRPLIPQVKDGKTPTKSELKAITKEVVDEVVSGLDRRQLAIDTINFIETLEGDDRLDAKKLKNLQEALSEIEIDAKKVKGLQDLLPKNPPIYAGGSGATFLKSLRDILNIKTATDGQALVKRGDKFQFETVSGGGASAFTDLTDTPSAYTGQGNKFVKVNAGETGLEFDTISGGGDMLASTYDPQNIADDAFDRANHTGEQAISTVTGLQTALDGKVDENASITGATKTKVTYDAKGLVTAGADATTADIADSSNKRYVTDAQLTVIGNTSGTNTGDQTSIVGITGTKAEFDTAVTDGNFLYVGDVTSNATHTGDVTGATALTLDKTAITGKTAVTALGADYVLISDTSDSGNLKKALASDLMGAGSVAWGGITGTLSNQTDLQTELARIEALSVALAVAL